MKVRWILKSMALVALLVLFVSGRSIAQDNVSLFNYWKYCSDAENSLYKHLCSRAFDQLSQRTAEVGKLQSKEEWMQRQAQVREKLLRLIGPFPQRTPLNARVTEVIKTKNYRVEKVIFESLPGYYVTSALFIPSKIRGKAPAILYACGHTAEGFRSDVYQHVIINLVMKGFVVFAFDPVGQGERLQYFDQETGKPRFGSTHEHSYPGAQCYISGYSPTKYFIWDAVRAIDYLVTRKEVDPLRIGMTGRSGGGTQTAYAAAIDDRILAAAPECFITSMKMVLKTIGPQDAEQNLFHMIKEGLDHADLLEVRAPKPTLIISTTRDFFSIQGARDTYREARKSYRALGFEGHIMMSEDDDGHASTKKNREAMYAFFQRYLDNPGDSADLDVEIFDPEELWVTETGQLSTTLKGETIFSLNKKIVQNQAEVLKASRLHIEQYLEKVPESVLEICGFEYPRQFGKAIFSGRYVKDDYILEKFLIPGSGDYMLPIALFKPSKNMVKEIVLIMDEQGMEYAANHDSLFLSLLRLGYPVLLFDLPGIGQLGPGYLKGDAYIDNISYNQWFAGNMTGKSIVGLRAEDIVRVVHFAHNYGGESITVSALAHGILGSVLLHAAVFEPEIKKIGLIRPFLSFEDIAITRDYKPAYIPSTVAGALNKYDLPDLIAVLCPRKVMVVNPVLADGSEAATFKIKEQLTFPLKVFSSKNAGGNLIITNEKGVYELFNQLSDWLK